jgi:hypothetical protein
MTLGQTFDINSNTNTQNTHLKRHLQNTFYLAGYVLDISFDGTTLPVFQMHWDSTILLYLLLISICDRSVVFTWHSGFLHQYWSPRYNWNIVESGVKTNIRQSMLKLKTHSGFHDIFRLWYV